MKRNKTFVWLFTCFSSPIFAAGLVPVQFTASPTFPQTVNTNATSTVSYTIKNNIPTQSVPLSFSTTISTGTLSPSSGSCGAALAGNASCTKTFLFTAPSSAQSVTGSVSVNYGGSYPLTDNTVHFSVNSVAAGAIVVTPNPAGVAVGGIASSINYPGTQQFNAIEISSTGTVNTAPTVTWSSSNTAAATINAAGLATGVSATGGGTGVTTITATDAANNASGATQLTVKAIGDTVSVTGGSGKVFCMGVGTNITNCPYLPSGKMGEVIGLADASASEKWDNTLPFVTTGAISPIDGATNTATLITAGTRYAAANLCSGNFYLPARNELMIAALNVLALNSAGAGFGNADYWTSSEYTSTLTTSEGGGSSGNANRWAWFVNFFNAYTGIALKSDGNRVRCVQAF